MANGSAHVVAENASGARGRFMEAEQCIDQGRLPCSVRAQQSHGAGGKRAAQIAENAPPTQIDCQAFEFDYGVHCVGCMRVTFPSKLGMRNGPPAPASASRFNPKKLPVEATSIRSVSP